MSPTRMRMPRLFGRPGSSRSSSAYPQIRVCVAGGEWHACVVRQPDGELRNWGKIPLAKARCLLACQKGMLCLADRPVFTGFTLWNQACDSGCRSSLAAFRKNMRLACDKRLPDDSYLSRIYPSERDWRHKDETGCACGSSTYRLGRHRRCRADLSASRPPFSTHEKASGQGTGGPLS